MISFQETTTSLIHTSSSLENIKMKETMSVSSGLLSSPFQTTAPSSPLHKKSKVRAARSISPVVPPLQIPAEMTSLSETYDEHRQPLDMSDLLLATEPVEKAMGPVTNLLRRSSTSTSCRFSPSLPTVSDNEGDSDNDENNKESFGNKRSRSTHLSSTTSIKMMRRSKSLKNGLDSLINDYEVISNSSDATVSSLVESHQFRYYSSWGQLTSCPSGASSEEISFSMGSSFCDNKHKRKQRPLKRSGML